MLKRMFWLGLAGVGAWLLYRLWQQRQEDFSATTPLLAPLEPYGRHIPSPAPAAAVPPAPPAAASPIAPAGAPSPTPPAPAAAPPVASPAPAAAPSAPTPVSPTVPAAAPVAQQPDDVAEAEALEGVSGYCARCKARRVITDPHEETTESGRRAARGTCPVCGAKMFTFLPNKAG